MGARMLKILFFKESFILWGRVIAFFRRVRLKVRLIFLAFFRRKRGRGFLHLFTKGELSRITLIPTPIARNVTKKERKSEKVDML